MIVEPEPERIPFGDKIVMEHAHPRDGHLVRSTGSFQGIGHLGGVAQAEFVDPAGRYRGIPYTLNPRVLR